MPWCRTGNAPALGLVEAARRIIRECGPQWWVVENVRGAKRYLDPILGAHRASYGPFFLWGMFPPFRCRAKAFKEKLPSRRKAERARIPDALSTALAVACESTLIAAGR